MSVILCPRGQEKAELPHSVVPPPCGLFTPMETPNLIWQDGIVLLPFSCAAQSPLHMALPGHLLRLTHLNCAESQNKMFQSLYFCYVKLEP